MAMSVLGMYSLNRWFRLSIINRLLVAFGSIQFLLGAIRHWLMVRPALNFIGKTPNKTETTDSYDAIAQEIITKASASPDFPMHHALASHLRAMATEGQQRGIKREREACAKLAMNYTNSFRYLLRYDAAECGSEIVKAILARK
jgi:hypothetical protein